MENFTLASLLTLVQHYGSIGLFCLLALGVIALPVPDETLLLLAGTLVADGRLNGLAAWIAAMGGAVTGISVSYILGRTIGHFAIIRLCRRFHLDEEHLHRTQRYFNRYGSWLLTVGYFIPGARHFTGIVAGTTQLPYRWFALFAYTGALLWSNLFFWLGYHFGMQALQLAIVIFHRLGWWLVLPFLIGIPFVYFFWRRR